MVSFTTSGSVTETQIGGRIDAVQAALALNAWTEKREHSHVHILSPQLVISGVAETGRLQFVGGVGAGPADRLVPRNFLRLESAGWTAIASARGGVCLRLLRTNYNQPEYRWVNFGIGLEAQAYATAQLDRTAVLALNLTVWSSRREY